MKRISIGIIIISLLSIAYSFSISAYTNEEEYREKYMALDWQALGSRNASNKFYELRDEYLSNKYKFQDYGFTLLILGCASLILFGNGLTVNAPTSNFKVALVGFGAALLTVSGYVGDLFLEFFRGSYPWWADSMGIPLMGVPVFSFIFIGWAALNLLAMNGKFKAGAPISIRQIKGSNYFYVFLFVVTALIVALCAAEAYFWMVLPGLVWLYFYASIWAGRYAANKSMQPTANASAD
ncbi:hypothetical protein [Teredinibacter turnerae]|uniref:hypothetical protein n=1 Tax=Teredinibacter turnerae TaxID=2426 RepID=UPI0006873528|nr:hypothetical protein [Teredinibacter turnerae]